MSAFEENKVVNFPLRLLKDPRLSEHELLVLIKILSYNIEHISIIKLDNDFNIKKNDIAPLVEKNLLKVVTSAADILIDINPMFSTNSTTPLTELEQPIVNTQQIIQQPQSINAMDHEFIQRVTLIWNRALNSMEIDKLNEWLNMGIMKTDIEQALQKAIFNNAQNFAYVETILLNNQTKRNSAQFVTRNVELY